VSTSKQKYRAVLFDLDDTLNDRTASWMAFVKLIASPSVQLIDPAAIEAVHARIVASDHGGYRPKRELFEELSAVLPLKAPVTAEDFEVFWRAHFPDCMVAREGMLEILSALRKRGLAIGIVTNGQAVTQMRKIEALGIRTMVDSIVISESAGVKKPDPRIFEMALNELKTEASTALFVGDDPKRDVLGAARGGMRTAWLRLGREWPSRFARPNYMIMELREVLDILND
jgi:putative hydrolase of the HAD superfamily